MRPAPGHAEGLEGRQEAATAMYVRTDSDQTLVVTPRLRVGTELGSTQAEVVYTVDVWSSASIDIRTSASLALTRQHERVIEQRDQINVNLAHEFDSLRLSGGYRYSYEPDYVSHGGTLDAEVDLAQRAATVGVGLLASFDQVGRVGDDVWWQDTRTLAGRLSYSQVLDIHSVATATYELGYSSGYLSSPYRFVGIGSTDGTCRGSLMFCAPETNPDERLRHALALDGRRALTDELSLGLGYRLYLDDWGMDSHTINAHLGWLAQLETLLSLRYRFYTQSAASHHQPVYAEPTQDQLYTHDKELSPLDSHRALLQAEHSWALDDDDGSLTTTLSLGPTFYIYHDHALLDSITAFEATLAMELAL